MKQLLNFLDSNARAQWITADKGRLSVYVRKSTRFNREDRTPLSCIDVATVNVREGEEGKGTFKRFLREVEQLARVSGRSVYVESVMNERLQGFLQRNGYVDTLQAPQPAPCYIKRFDKGGI